MTASPPATFAVLAVLAVLLAAPLAAETAEERGDRAFRRRAAGFAETGAPSAGPIDAAIAAYEEALEREPGRLDLRFKLMEAVYFKGYHVERDAKRRREHFDRLIALATRALELVEAAAGGAETLSVLEPAERAGRLRAVPGAAAALYWTTAAWGLWGMTHSSLAALRRGVGGKVRDHARLLAEVDERYRDAAGLRMLGRLYTEAPKVPLVTGWIDRREGLAMLRRAVEISRRDPRNLFFLAEAILRFEKERRAEALELLRELARRQPDPDQLVEHTETLEQARALLAEVEK